MSCIFQPTEWLISLIWGPAARSHAEFRSSPLFRAVVAVSHHQVSSFPAILLFINRKAILHFLILLVLTRLTHLLLSERHHLLLFSLSLLLVSLISLLSELQIIYYLLRPSEKLSEWILRLLSWSRLLNVNCFDGFWIGIVDLVEQFS